MFTRDTNKKTIEFSYKLESIFNNAARASAFSAKNIKDKEGKSMFADYALSDDEKDMFYQGLTSVMPEIYDKIIKLTSGISNAFVFDVTATDVKFTIQDNEAYNSNVLQAVDATLAECIVDGALKMWYKNCAHAELLGLYTQTFEQNLNKLFDRMFQLKLKKTVSMLCEIK